MQQRPTDQLRVRLYTLLCLVGLVAGPPLAGQSPELTETVPLNADLVVVELWDADLDILVSANTKPVLRTKPAPQGYSIDVDLHPAEEAASGVTTMHFRRALDVSLARLRVEMVVHPEQQLQITGRGLDITLESGQGVPAHVELAVEDSEANLSGLRDLRAEVTSTSLRLAETSGALDLTFITSGALEILGHQGSLKLVSTEADIELEDFEGNFEANLEGGSLRMDRGSGAWVGQARDTQLFFGDWLGELELTAWNSTFEARGAPEAALLWKLSGSYLMVILEETEGPLEIDLVGGRLQAQGVRGDGKTTLKLSDGAEALLVEVDGALAVAVEDGGLEVEGVAVFELSASRSTVVLSGVQDLHRLDATDSTLTVDLTATTTAPGLLFAGQSEADISLATPCAVEISAVSTAPESQVQVTDCELRLPTDKAFKPFDQGPQLILTVTLNGESVLRVEGQR